MSEEKINENRRMQEVLIDVLAESISSSLTMSEFEMTYDANKDSGTIKFKFKYKNNTDISIKERND